MNLFPAAWFEGDEAHSGIGLSLLGLIAVAVLPLLALSVGVGWTIIDQKKAALASELGNTARALRVAVDRELLNQIPAMQILATDASLDSDDRSLFLERARRAVAAHRDWRSVGLIDPKSYRVVATTVAVPNPPPTTLAPRQVDEAVSTRKPLVAGVFAAGRVYAEPLVLFLAPVASKDRIALVLSVAMHTKPISEVFIEQQLPAAWTGVVVDNHMRIAGRSREPARYVGARVTPSLEERIGSADSGMFTALNQEGAAVYTVFSRSPLTGWSVAIGIPEAEVEAPIRRLLLQLAGVGGALIALALMLAAVVARGIVHRRNAYERALQASEDRFRGLTEISSDWYWEQDENLRFSFISSGVIMQHRNVDEILGKTRWEVPHTGTDPQAMREHDALLAARKPFKDLVIKRLGRDNTIHYVETSGEPIFDAQGRFKGYRGVGREISERMRAEESIRQLNASLEDRVAERTAGLQQALRDIESFSYSASHDLRTPLRAINGYAEILMREERDRLSDTGARMLERIAKAAIKLGKLIDEVLEYSRLGREQMRQEQVDLNALCRSVVEELQPLYPRARIALAPLPRVTGDPIMLKHILQNLIENACKFSAEAADPLVEVGVAESAGERAFCVKDSGVGFDMRDAGKLFGMFQRLHAEGEFAGMGVGLVAVKRLVERHGGRVWAESEPGKGARFFFTLGKHA